MAWQTVGPWEFRYFFLQLHTFLLPSFLLSSTNPRNTQVRYSILCLSTAILLHPLHQESIVLVITIASPKQIDHTSYYHRVHLTTLSRNILVEGLLPTNSTYSRTGKSLNLAAIPSTDTQTPTVTLKTAKKSLPDDGFRSVTVQAVDARRRS